MIVLARIEMCVLEIRVAAGADTSMPRPIAFHAGRLEVGSSVRVEFEITQALLVLN